jgi:hypothetical protein
MFPIPQEQLLSLRLVADYYSRELRPSASQQEVSTKLIEAVWRGDCIIPSFNRVSKLHLLFNAAKRADRDVRRGPPWVILQELPGGQTVLKIIGLAEVPLHNATPESWNEENCTPAFLALAKDWELLEGHSIELFIGAVPVPRAAFFDLVTRRGWQRPTFWGDFHEVVQQTTITHQTLRRALDKQIHEAIEAVYKQAGDRPPNIKKIAVPVLKILHGFGVNASKAHIEEIADLPVHKARRRPPGATYKSERDRKQSNHT